MRTGVPTLHQALTPEAASVLKLSLSLAQRRNHAQVTPLHVASTLLTSHSLSNPNNLLKRACLKSQQSTYQNTLLHCRALELCFNVALNRLPSCTSPSSSSTNGGTNPNSLMHSYPTLSNALIAALKRAQANQRRGCIEFQQQQNHLPQNQALQNQNQQNQPLLAIKVELEQLIVSILDDPSVSRVMREAGFSSSSVKNSLEDERERETSVLGLGQNKDIWPAQFMKPLFDQGPHAISSQKEDLRVIFEVMVRKKQEKKRNNPVIIGDSVSMAEGLVEEMRRKLERGEVPEELKMVRFVKFSISTYMKLGFIGKREIEMKVDELKRNASSSQGVIIYIGDLKWATGDDPKCELGLGFSAIGSIIEEIEKLVVNGGSRVWILGVSSFQTYMQVKKQRPSLESKWGLHAVTVPCDGLSLSLQASNSCTKLNKGLFQIFDVPQKSHFEFTHKEEGEERNEMLCFECNTNYEREASLILNSDKKNTGGIQLPDWLRPNRPDMFLHKGNLMELRRKWSRLCQKLHQFKNNPFHFSPPLLSSNLNSKNLPLPLWGPCAQNKPFFEQHSVPFPKKWAFESNPNQEIKTNNLFLGGLFNLSDSASSESKDTRKRGFVEVQELERQLRENIPWNLSAIGSIVEAFERKESLILLEGSDEIAKIRVSLVIAEIYCGSADKLVRFELGKIDFESFSTVFEEGKRCVILIEDVDRAPMDFLKSVGSFKLTSDSILILTTTSHHTMLRDRLKVNTNESVKLVFSIEEAVLPSENEFKRKTIPQNEFQSSPKKPRLDIGLDLNQCVGTDEEIVVCDEEEAIPSDITHEGDEFDHAKNLPQTLVQKIGSRISLDTGSNSCRLISDRITGRLNRAYEEVSGEEGQFGNLVVDKEVEEWLVWAYGSCLEALFEMWVREVFQTCVPSVKKGGKVRLGLGLGLGLVEGGGGIEGFSGTVLPKKIHGLNAKAF
ncbi:hypothetical protein LUZ60_017472 [Juncus effusus]|nr:hypothetical protein LUZ60_017472 [Juncus effusus]